MWSKIVFVTQSSRNVGKFVQHTWNIVRGIFYLHGCEWMVKKSKNMILQNNFKWVETEKPSLTKSECLSYLRLSSCVTWRKFLFPFCPRTDEVVLLASSRNDLRLTLERFAASMKQLGWESTFPRRWFSRFKDSGFKAPAPIGGKSSISGSYL